MTQAKLLEGKEFPLRIGQTFAEDENRVGSGILRFDFRPETMDDSKVGTISLDGQDVTAEFHSTQLGQHHRFKGKSTKNSMLDCVLIFDEETETFSLERQATKLDLKRVVEDMSKTKHSEPKADSQLQLQLPVLEAVKPNKSERPKSDKLPQKDKAKDTPTEKAKKSKTMPLTTSSPSVPNKPPKQQAPQLQQQNTEVEEFGEMFEMIDNLSDEEPQSKKGLTMHGSDDSDTDTNLSKRKQDQLQQSPSKRSKSHDGSAVKVPKTLSGKVVLPTPSKPSSSSGSSSGDSESSSESGSSDDSDSDESDD